MKYYVIYQTYTEYNQFEGDWSTDFHKFESFEEAQRFIDNDIMVDELIAGPLVDAKYYQD
jgi:viroplasmin and RNaseH domain-containing protein